MPPPKPKKEKIAESLLRASKVVGSKWIMPKGIEPWNCVLLKMENDNRYVQEVLTHKQQNREFDGSMIAYGIESKSKEDLEKCKLTWNQQKGFVTADGTSACTRGRNSKGGKDVLAFVVDLPPESNLYVDHHTGAYDRDKNILTHGSFFQGHPLECTGLIGIDETGFITKITPNSGHYQPEAQDIFRVYQALMRKHAPDNPFAPDAVVVIEGKEMPLARFVADMETKVVGNQSKYEQLVEARKNKFQEYQAKVAENITESPSKRALVFALKDYAERGQVMPVAELEEHLKKGATLNAYDDHKKTPLHYAVQSGDLTLVKACLAQRNAHDQQLQDPNRSDAIGRTPLDFAYTAKGSVRGDALIQMIQEAGGVTGLHSAASLGDVERARRLIQEGAPLEATDARGSTPLFYTTNSSNAEISRLLIDAGANVNARDHDNKTPVFWLAQRAHNNKEIIAQLKEKGVDMSDPGIAEFLLKALDSDGNTALHRAARDGDVDKVNECLKNRLSVNGSNNFQQTPLHLAARGNNAALTALIDAGANLRAVDMGVLPPIYYAAAFADDPEMIGTMLSKVGDAEMHKTDAYGRTPADFAMTYNRNPKVVQEVINTLDRNYETLLHKAITDNDPIKFNKLLKAGADIHKKGVGNSSALHYVAKYNRTDFIQPLLDAGADLSALDSFGRTPLHHFAANCTDERIIKQMLDAGADLQGKDNGGFTTMHYAFRNPNPAALRLLVNVPDVQGEALINHVINDSIYVENKVDAIHRLADAGANLEQASSLGISPLVSSVMSGSIEALNALLERGALVNAISAKGFTALDYATGKGDQGVIDALKIKGAKTSKELAQDLEAPAASLGVNEALKKQALAIVTDTGLGKLMSNRAPSDEGIHIPTSKDPSLNPTGATDSGKITGR